MPGTSKNSLAVLWDESFMWGLIALDTFRRLGLDVRVLTASEVRSGSLDGADTIFVPGGWASDKTVRLGEDGRQAIRSFVRAGGGYMGFCGGAGLALSVKGGLGLVDVLRVPTEHRVPSFSGRMRLRPEDSSHPVWKGIRRPYEFYAWWPGQFSVREGSGVSVVARYGGFGEDFSTADLTAKDVDAHDEGWSVWEDKYGINLEPGRLIGEPAMLESVYGKGRVFLSYLHLETPGSRKGHTAVMNLVGHLARKSVRRKKAGHSKPKTYAVDREAAAAAAVMLRAVRRFISFGERNFLWRWRNPWVLYWRRGVRGVEYSMLHALVRTLASIASGKSRSTDPDFSARVLAVAPRLEDFLTDARSLLMKERLALMSASMSTIRSDDPEVNRLRERLFSGSKRLGGEYKSILDELDGLVLSLLRA